MRFLWIVFFVAAAFVVLVILIPLLHLALGVAILVAAAMNPRAWSRDHNAALSLSAAIFAPHMITATTFPRSRSFAASNPPIARAAAPSHSIA